ncbi:hypothetical protein [Sphingomonas oligoaromativorans]|uniref:hypothetical protein n=1 Tax=Sphingomonas oligoaromativorans TaxID=575322 RepID=UPI001ABB1AF6|nr:hypothetical protein [Sphingomonas oligoaromativorans]NIJ35300.1 hypothetical protein [Sphingomonas oligoaromativorans]
MNTHSAVDCAITSARLIQLPLEATNAIPEPLTSSGSMPICSVQLPDLGLVLSASADDDTARFRDAMRATATALGSSVLVIAHGKWPETLNPVHATALIELSSGPLLLDNLLFYRDRENGLWFIPANGRGLWLALGHNGLCLSMTAPYVDREERSTGLCRAAAEIVRMQGRY